MRSLRLAALAFAVALAGCGSSQPPAKAPPLPPSVKQACPRATTGHGAMGQCAPPGAVHDARPGLVHASSASAAGITFPDFSNNDPCVCGAQLKAHGHAGEIDKVNQGTGFIDRTFPGMASDAYHHGLAVGGYDFDERYTADEAYVFVHALEAAGIRRGTPRTFPPTLDVEFGVPSRTGLEHQLAVLKRVYGRAQIYTGGWYWLPHFGCWVPAGVGFWISGYPTARILCGLSGSWFKAHQFTDHGYTGAGRVPFADLSVYLGNAASFAAYVHATPPKPSRRQLEEQLWHLYRVRSALAGRIAVLSGLLTKYGCRPPHHAHVRLSRAQLARYRRRACPTWKVAGDGDHVILKRLPGEIARAKARLR